jgi:acyl-CoA thioester hydrolase
MKFSHAFTVAAQDIDEQNHVNNVAYVRWIQDVAVAHWRSVTSEETRERYTWVVVRHEIDYKKQAFENEEITAETWVGEAEKVTWERLTEIRRGETVLVKARSQWILIDRSINHPVRVKAELKQLFQMV